MTSSCNCLVTAKIWSGAPEGLNAKMNWTVSCKVTQDSELRRTTST